jgi:hypothetical protein
LLEFDAACPAVTSEEAGMQLPPLKKAESRRAETQPQVQKRPPQKKTILDARWIPSGSG